MRITAVLFFFLLCPLLFHPPAGHAAPMEITVEEAVRMAMRANYDVKIAKERLNKIEAVIGEARSAAFPQITGTASYQRNVKLPQLIIAGQQYRLGFYNEYTAAATFSQAIYSAGRVLKALKAAKEEMMSTEAVLKETREEIKLQVKRTFYQVLLAERVIEIKKKTLKQLTEQLDAIRKRYEGGIESDYTLMRQEVQVSNILPELSAVEHQRIVLINALKDLLALPSNEEIRLKGSLTFHKADRGPQDALIEMALKQRRDLEAKAHHVLALKKNVGIEFGGYLPTVGLFSGINWQAQSDKFSIKGSDHFYSVNVGIGLSLPIFDGLKTHYRIREAEAELKIASEEEMQLRAKVASEVKNIRSLLEEAAGRETSQKKALNLAQKAVDIASLRFGNGLTSQLELNDTILQRDQAEQLYAQAVYDCISADLALKRAIGGEL